jgi:low affinity Fe/Cu permease
MRDKEDEARTKLIEADGDIEKFAELIRADERTKREWVGLTDEEIHEIRLKTLDSVATNYEAYRAIEAKLKEKNT